MAKFREFFRGVAQNAVANAIVLLLFTTVPVGAVAAAFLAAWDEIWGLHPFYLVIGALVCVVAIQWLAIGAVFWRRKARPANVEAMRASPIPIVPHEPYNTAWEFWDALPLWQVACLWAGEEPYLPIAHGTKPYPHLKIMEGAIKLSDLKAVGKSDQEMAWWMVTREDMIEFINKRGFSPRPPFLFPNG